MAFDALAASKGGNLKLCGDHPNSSKMIEQENYPQILPNGSLLLVKVATDCPASHQRSEKQYLTISVKYL